MNFQKVVQDKKQRQAMDEEFKAIMKNDAWKLTTLPKGHKAIGAKWCTKLKKNDKYKIKNTRQGYLQKAIHKKSALTMMRYFLMLPDGKL